MGAGLVIHPNGNLVEVNLQPGENNLALMYEHLGCSTVDVVRLSAVLDMWLDEEGMFTQVVNPIATALARTFGYVPAVLRARLDLRVHDSRRQRRP